VVLQPSGCRLLIVLLVGIATLRRRTETKSRAGIIVAVIAATVIVLVFFPMDTLHDAPETFSAIVGIARLSVILDLVWKRNRDRQAIPRAL
jgi:O-antigen ligase